MTRQELERRLALATPQLKRLLRDYVKYPTESNKAYIIGYITGMEHHGVLSANASEDIRDLIFNGETLLPAIREILNEHT